MYIISLKSHGNPMKLVLYDPTLKWQMRLRETGEAAQSAAASKDQSQSTTHVAGPQNLHLPPPDLER